MSSPDPIHGVPKDSGAEHYSHSAPDVAYGSANFGETAAHRNFRDYLLILRERIWYIIVVFLVIMSVAVLYTLSRTPLFTSATSIEVYRQEAVVIKAQEVRENEIRDPVDFNTQVEILNSFEIVRAVEKRLTGDDLKAFLAPFQEPGAEPVQALEILSLNKKVVPRRQTRIIQVVFSHPSSEMAAKVADLFAEEYITFNARQRINESMKAVEDLKVRAQAQAKQVQEISAKLQAYKENHNMVSLDERRDVVTERLKALNLLLAQNTSRFKDAEVRWNQVREIQQRNGDLTELSFIASQPLIQTLSQQVAAQKISLAQLQQRYRAKHPKMLEATQALAQTENEFRRAVEGAANNVRTEFESTRGSMDEARTSLASQESEALKMGSLAGPYNELLHELQVNEQVLANTLARMRETSMTANIETQNARIVDRALRSPKPSSPRKLINFAVGGFAGLGLGLAFAFFVAFIDDRVKSAFDIESVVGLPLVGIVPQLRKLDPAQKAQIVLTGADRQVAESFLSLHSSLRLKDESKAAQVFLVTSTTPSEGKSFVTSNLALTFAAHGDRTLLIDCDLRKPTVHKLHGLENSKGLIDYCNGTATLDAVIAKQRYPNLDIIPSGGRAKNPTHILNGKNFETMLAELRKRYDRIFIDTPPLAAVSDAMVILPLVDGSLYTILFNHVRRKAAQFCAHKLNESNVPCFGAVLNGLNLAVSGYYYAQYYDKSYKDYYVTMSDKSLPEK